MNYKLSRQQNRRRAALTIIAVATLAAHAGAVTIDTVPVGNAGNANDSTGLPQSPTTIVSVHMK